jgi:hypothetical protein
MFELRSKRWRFARREDAEAFAQTFGGTMLD